MNAKHLLLRVLALFLILPGIGNAQLPTEPVPESQLVSNTSYSITIGRLWWGTSCAANYAETYIPNVISYPGFYQALDHMDMIAPFIMFDNQGISAYINLEERNIVTYGGAIVPFELHNNYNFVGDGGIDEAEQWGQGVFQTFRMQLNAPDQPQGAVLITTKSRAWSVPKYDDFVIHHVKMKNVDERAIHELLLQHARTGALWRARCGRQQLQVLKRHGIHLGSGTRNFHVLRRRAMAERRGRAPGV